MRHAERRLFCSRAALLDKNAGLLAAGNPGEAVLPSEERPSSIPKLPRLILSSHHCGMRRFGVLQSLKESAYGLTLVNKDIAAPIYLRDDVRVLTGLV